MEIIRTMDDNGENITYWCVENEGVKNGIKRLERLEEERVELRRFLDHCQHVVDNGSNLAVTYLKYDIDKMIGILDNIDP